jgi:hypothetical protein
MTIKIIIFKYIVVFVLPISHWIIIFMKKKNKYL